MGFPPHYGMRGDYEADRTLPAPSTVPGDPVAQQEMQEDADAACDPAEQERIWRLIQDSSVA